MKLLHSTCIALVASVFFVKTSNAGDYGVDCSWPIHGDLKSECSDLFEIDRQSVYEEYMQGCREKWGEKGARRCDANEKDRIEMSKRQPQSMVNYTSTGFKKIKAPKPLWDMIRSYWEKNKDDMKEENWGIGNIYTK